MRFRNMRLQHRIFLYFSLLVILSTILFGYYAYEANVRTAEENFTFAISGSMGQAANELQNLLQKAEQQANMFADSYIVQDSLSYETASELELYERYSKLDNVIDVFEKNDDRYSIRVLIDQPRRFMIDRDRYTPANEFHLDTSNMLSRSRLLYWTFQPTEGKDGKPVYFSVHREIVNNSNIGVVLGTVVVGVDQSAVTEIFDSVTLSDSLNLHMINKNGQRLSFDNGNGYGNLSDYVSPDNMNRIVDQTSGSVQIESEEGPKLLVYHKLNGFPFYLAVDIPADEISNRSQQILSQFVMVALLVLSASFIVAYLISRSMTSRLKRLIQVMSNVVDKRRFDTQVPSDRYDEIGILTTKFNWMLRRIHTLIVDVYKSNYEKKEAELKMLQAQINPHFLYNTLDSVNWLAVKHNTPEIGYMVRNLSHFLRLSLRSDKNSTLGTELKHIGVYFRIQKYRFEERIVLIDEVPESLHHLEVFPLMLQPLVENAILHGILKHENRNGVIVIRAKVNEDRVILEVEDNGLGIDPVRLSKITERFNRDSDEESDEDTGSGMLNVHRRLRFRFGPGYGLSVHSKPGAGTTCMLTLPFNASNKEE